MPTLSGPSASIRLFQVFDFALSPDQAAAAGPRYELVWGAGISDGNLPQAWRSRHDSLLASRYFIMEQSDPSHPLAWYQANHPDWILYNCTSNGDPTQIPAYMQGGAYGKNAPLDIHNPAVIDFQVRALAIPPAVAAHQNALAVDQVVFSNLMGGNAGKGSYGCGVYQAGTFVRRYTSRGDSAWASDTVNWIRTAKSILAGEAHHLKMVVNHPAGSTSNGNEQNLLANVDAAMSEVGFVDYGGYKNPSDAGLFKRALNYMAYTQSHGVTSLLIDKFVQSSPVSSTQLEYALATYLMGNNGNALLYVTSGGYGSGGYGREHYFPEYQTNIGAPCGSYYGDSTSPHIFYRKYFNGLAVVNSGSLPVPYELATLPAGRTYRDIEGRAVSNPLAVASNDAYVLLTSPGAGCQ